MGFQIQDGTGSSRKVKIDSRNRMVVDAITEERAVYNSVADGKTFIMYTDFISFTGSGTNQYGLIYFKNNSDQLMLVHHVKIWLGTLNQIVKIRMYDDPTTGTLISSAIPCDINNINMGSSQEFEGLAYQGSGGTLTVTDGMIMGRHFMGSGNQQMMAMMWNGAMVLPKGASMAMTVQPPNGVTVEMTAEIEVYYEDAPE